MTENFRLVSVEEAAPKLGRSKQGLYRDIRENQFPWPHAVVRFGKVIKLNLTAVEEAMRPQNTAAQKAAA